jgi:hypothetical protein
MSGSAKYVVVDGVVFGPYFVPAHSCPAQQEER